jgi:UDP-N-acetylglucosamine/UDP-N-acetylgalactosamine diphosphorylase
MPPGPEELHEHLLRYGQEHVLAGWDRLSGAERDAFAASLKGLNLKELRELYQRRDEKYPLPDANRIEPVPVAPAGGPDVAQRRAQGEAALHAGEVAVLVVAGGQGTRLGSDQPKGFFPVGPISGRSLYQIHAEKVLALSQRSRVRIPFLIMTSPATDAATRAFFADHRGFGLATEDVHFFCQGTMPALDLATGHLLLEAPGRLFLSPDGHGGTLTALHDSGLLDQLLNQGVRHLFYFQVDNPLVKVADPEFLGRHIDVRSEVSSKVVPKLGPTDKLGNFAQVDGRCTIIEYSDLPRELAEQRDDSGRLLLWGGNTAIHIFDLPFLARVNRLPERIPFHLARKKVPHIDPQGRPVRPEAENALKFERFIFDILPLAQRWLIAETSRREEFAPLKNAEGADSPTAVRQALSDLAADWLEAAGATVPRRSDGSAPTLEISPLFALDRDELARKVKRGTVIREGTWFE